MSGGLILAIESSCDETGIALIEDGRLIRSNVVASQVALHAASGGIVPEVAARAHLRWIVPVLDEAWADADATWADIDAVAVTYGPGLAGSLLVGVNFAKALAWVHEKPLVAVNHLEGHVYAAWLRDPGEAERPDPVFPLVALVVSGGHTFLAEMPDHLTYRLLGTTLDDAAGEAFDKVGRLLGLPYPGGPAIGRAAEAATRRDRVFPRAWLGDSYDLSFSGLKTAARRIVAEARAEAGLADTPAAPLPEAVVAELAWGFEDAVVDVLATKTIRAAKVDRRAVDRDGRWGGGQPRAPGASRRGGRGARHPADRAATGPVHRQRGDDRGGRRAAVRGRRAGRASIWMRGPHCRWPLKRPGEQVRRAADRSRRRAGHASRGGPARPPQPVAELPGRPRRPRGDPRRGGSRPRTADPRDRAGAGAADRRSPRRRRRGHRGRARSGARGVPARALRRRRDAPADRGRRARPGPRPPRGTALRRRGEPAVPHHEPDPARAPRGAATTGALGPDGPARGRGTDRGAAREDELPLGLRPVPRARPDRVRGPGGRLRARTGGRVGRHRRRAVRRRRPARSGERGRVVAPRPGRLPRASQDDPQRPVPPAPARCRSRDGRPWRPRGSRRTAGRRRWRSGSGSPCTRRSARSGPMGAAAATTSP